MNPDPRQQIEDQRVDFEDVKAWIAVQEAYQVTTSLPAPLTALQRKALSSLKLHPVPPKVVELGNMDWISLIHRYCDANRRLGINIEFPEATPTGNGQWIATCIFSESASPDPMSFPGPGNGFVELAGTGAGTDPTGAPPFPTKRDARRYAARCCAEWLQAQSRLPASAVISPAGRGPNPPSPPSSPTAVTPAGRGGGGGGGGGGGSSGSDGNDSDGMSAAQRAAELCTNLRLPPLKYDLRQSSGNAVGYWSGGLDFGAAVIDIPPDVGRVENVYGKKNAQNEVAKQLLVYLRKMKAERDADFERLS